MSGKSFAPNNVPSNENPPTKKRLANYVAALPDGSDHSEERLFPLIERLRFAYQKKYKKMPKTLVFYSWAIPCWRKTCSSSQCTTGCTQKVKTNLKKYVDMGMEVVLAFTSLGGNMKNCKCDVEATRRYFANSNIAVKWVDYKTKKNI